MKKKNKIGDYLLMILFSFVILEVSSFITIKLYLKNYGIIYNHKVDKNYDKYLKKRHEILGWDTSSKNVDDYGARKDYSSYNESNPCIDVYGDSFTYGNFKPEKAWPSLLSELVNCRVRNFGVDGFGSDQAYIKFLINTKHSKIVFLNHLSENIIRNVNQYRNFIYPSNDYLFKPRYILQDNELKLIPLTNIPKEKISEYLVNPKKYLKYEYFIPNGPSGIQHWKFPYTFRVLKSFNHWAIKQKIQNISVSYSNFYEIDHLSNGLNLTFKIMSNFYENSKKQELVPIITIFPTCKDLQYFSKYKKLPYDNLIRLFENENYLFIDFGSIFLEKSKKNHDRFYEECSGHYNEDGEVLVAETILKYLKSNNLLSNL